MKCPHCGYLFEPDEDPILKLAKIVEKLKDTCEEIVTTTTAGDNHILFPNMRRALKKLENAEH